MPRQPRRSSGSGYMHLVVRGIGKQVLFEEREDFRFFLSKLEQFCRETGVKVCAYCLMDNHVHLLVHDEKANTPLLMKKLGVSYSRYYNRKYDRTGHLFQDRYLSEAVEDERYLMVVFRYILNNPKKAGICSAEDYQWSSYGKYDDHNSFVDTELLRELIGNGEQYRAFIAGDHDDVCMDLERPARDDEQALRIIRSCVSTKSGTSLQACNRKDRDDALRRLKDAGLTVRQIERLTGINRGIIQRA